MARQRFVVLSLAAALALVLFPGTTFAQDDIQMSFRTETAGEEPHDMTMTVSGDMARFDFDNMVAMIFSADWLRMVQIQEQQCIEFDREMMNRMRDMMANMPGAPRMDEMEEIDPTSFTFERTGNTDTILEHDVFEVAFSDGSGNSGQLWLTESAEVGMFEVMSAMMTHLESLAGPMMGGGPGGQNPAAQMRQYMQYARAQGLPEGRVLRMVSDDGTRFEVTGWDMGPFGADTWESPYECQQMQIPGFQR